MKNVLNYLIMVIPLVLLGLSGCTKDDPAPSPTDPRKVFEGKWGVNEIETKLYYTVDIELDPVNKNAVFIYDFADVSSPNPAVAYVSGTTITLEINQVIGDGLIINGSGVLQGTTKIFWPYTLNDGANIHQIEATFTKL